MFSLPVETVEQLTADAFPEREAAQAELQEWAERTGDRAVDELVGLWEASEDPEIQERVLQVLKGLSDKAYQQEGKAYLGITMQDTVGGIDGDKNQRFGIIITEILRDSPADSSELMIGDVIISMNGEDWKEKDASEIFKAAIARMKPGTEVVLKVERAEEAIEVKVVLGRSPVPNLIRGMGDLRKLEAKAKEAFFKQWMAEKRKLKK
ncbi:MAG: PDZ domain-containing protein [Luteolibacter sp.]